MYYAYGLQALSQPTGNVKIGFSRSPMVRLKAHERGALGERLHIIFQTEAGQEYGSGRKLELTYHRRFGPLRIIYEWFRFDPEMITWFPIGTRRVYAETNDPAENTLPAPRLTIGDQAIFCDRTPIIQPYRIDPPHRGDLSDALTMQRIMQSPIHIAASRDSSRRDTA